jgi:hypothetical protein
MSEAGKCVAALMCVLVAGIALVCHGLGYTRLAYVVCGALVCMSAAVMLGAMLRRGDE